MPIPRILTIAGSDSGGGAGIQADLKTITCLGGYGMSAITALTAQNTQGVFGIHNVPPEFVAQQIRLALEDIGADAIKTGMLGNAGVIEAVASALVDGGRWMVDGEAPNPHQPPATSHQPPLILDPVMIAKGGAALLEPEAVEALKALLIPRALLITPNIPEAELLAGMTIRTIDDMKEAAEKIAELGAANVLIKGGHLDGEMVVNVLLIKVDGGRWRVEGDIHTPSTLQPPSTIHHLSSPRIHTTSTHGTGCTLASAIATFIAKGEPLKAAVEKAEAYVSEAIRHAPGLGHGHGPLGHNYRIL